MLIKYFNTRPMLTLFGILFAIWTALLTPYYNHALAENQTTNNSSLVSVDLINYWGSLGNDPTQFSANNSVAASRTVCTDNQISNLGNLSALGPLGCWSNPRGIAVNSSGNVYVADTIGRHIKMVDKDGNMYQMGSFGNGNDQFSLPWDIAADSSNHVYIADSCCNHRVAEFTDSGNFVRKWGGYGPPDGNGSLNTKRLDYIQDVIT